MNINPSDTDVRQGFSLAESAATAQSVLAAARSAEPQRSSAQPSQSAGVTPNETDAKSSMAAAAADKRTAQETAQKLGKQLEDSDTGLKIRVLDDSQNRVQVEIVDQKSNKVLRKIPQDDLLKLSASIKEMTGVLLNNPA
jgi:flagellar protein FlaG